MRGSLSRSHAAFSRGGQCRVAFMGGSVTTRQWRNPLMADLRKRFPQAEFDFIMAGIGGTNADLGAFRLPEHVFGRGKVDLFFLEFAVNGGDVRAMEGIVRQAKTISPDIDIVLMYFANTAHTTCYNDGRIPRIVLNHEKVAEHYAVPALYLYREVARRIEAGKMTWKDFSTDSVHPTQLGCDIYAECITGFLDAAWKTPKPAAAASQLPEPLDPFCYGNGMFVALDKASVTRGFALVEGWTPTKTCNFRGPVDVLTATEPEAELSLEFEGRAVGIYTIVGMDTGTLEYSIDGAPVKTLDPFDHYCPRFHRPKHTIFTDELQPGKHTLTLRSGAGKNAKSEGHAVRILKFMVNR